MNSSVYIYLAVFMTLVLAEELRNKKDVIYSPHEQISGSVKLLTAGGYNDYNYRQPYYQSLYPYNQNYYPQQPYHRYNNYQYNEQPYENQQFYHYVIRQAPPYPSPGAQPIHPPVPPPFYHPPGWYYPVPITEKPTTIAPQSPKI